MKQANGQEPMKTQVSKVGSTRNQSSEEPTEGVSTEDSTDQPYQSQHSVDIDSFVNVPSLPGAEKKAKDINARVTGKRTKTERKRFTMNSKPYTEYQIEVEPQDGSPYSLFKR